MELQRKQKQLRNEAVEQEHVYVIKNGNPASLNSQQVWKRAEKILKKEAILYSVFVTKYAGHAKVIAEDLLRETSIRTLLLVVGGDGTMHEVINGAAPYPHAIVACIPAGSGNDYARGVQKTLNVKEAIKLIQKPDEASRIDLGQMQSKGNKCYFMNSLGLGFDASICEVVNRSKWKPQFQKWKLGKFIYLYYFLKQLFIFKPFSLQVEVDGRHEEYDHVWLIVVANQPYFGGGLKVSPNSTTNDGKFHVLVVNNLSARMFLLVFATIFWGGHLRLSKWVRHFTCNEIKLETEQTVPIQADGEVIGDSIISAKIIPKKLLVTSKR